MTSPLHQLSRPALLSLAHACEAKRLPLPCSSGSILAYVPSSLAEAIAHELNHLHAMGMTPSLMAHTLSLLAQERQFTQQTSDSVDVVWTGEEFLGAESRDTAVVVQELFASAQQSVLIASYVLDPKKSQSLFSTLADKMDADPSLQVRMFLNIQRKDFKDKTPESTVLRQYATTFRQNIWPGQRLPEVFYYPPALAISYGPKACLHAKCIVIDEERVLITSANFTEAAHHRNIEAGVLINDAVAARGLRSQFETLATQNIMCRIPGL